MIRKLDRNLKNMLGVRVPRILLISCTCPEPSTPSLGLTSVATYLIDKGFDVRIFDDSPYMLDIKDDTTDPREKIGSVIPTDNSKLYCLPFNQRFADLLELVNSFSPHIVGISTTEPTFLNGLEYLKVIKKENPSIKTIVGGPFAILAPEIVMNYGIVDMIAYGEGEKTMESLGTILSKNENYQKTCGIMFRDSNGTIHRNPLPDMVDVNELVPLKYSLYNEKRLYRPISGEVRKMLPLEISRGCPYECSFCASPEYKRAFSHLGKWHRIKNLKQLDEEISTYVINYEPEYFFFISETFLAMSKSQLDEFIEVYGRYKVPFWMNTRPETITEYAIRSLKKVGLERMSVGVECGNEGYRSKYLNRNYSNACLVEVFKILHEYDIKVTANVMIGLPDETESMIFDSIELIQKLSPTITSVGLAIFQPYKGTKLYRYCVKNGYCQSSRILNTTCYSNNLKNPYLSNEQLQKLFLNFNKNIKIAI